MTATLKLDAFLPYRLSIASSRVSGTIAEICQARFGLRIPEWRLTTVLAEWRRDEPAGAVRPHADGQGDG